MRKCTVLAALLLSTVVASSLADTVLYDFEVGGVFNNQGWSSYGTATTDSGQTNDASVGSFARFHSFNMALGSWGIGDKSPKSSATYGFGDLNPYAGISADVKLTVQDPPTSLTTVEMLLAIGYMEWTSFHTMTSDYQTISASFADLIPQSSATEPITAAQLASPDLQIKFVIRRGTDTGKGVLRYDHITAWVPEPAALSLLALVGLTGLRRR